jgi:hypothetical protein
MKQLIYSLIMLCSLTLNAQNVNIPDANFKAYLVGNTAINTNSDTEIQLSEAQAFTGAINASNLSISDLRGIEAFTALTSLSCSGNQLDSIDLSQNTALQYLYANANNFTTIDLSQNVNLYYITLAFNDLISLDLSQNISLRTVICNNNQISSLDVSNNDTLTTLECDFNQLTALNLSQNPFLSELDCRDNDITTLDVSNCSGLYVINVRNNNLSSLNVANGNNSNIADADFDARSNPSLSCIQVDDAAWSTTNWTNVASIVSFSENCSGTTSTSAVDFSSALNIYPNPTTAFIQIESPTNIDLVEIHAADGKLIRIVENSTQIDLSTYPKGLYLLKIQTAQGISTKKIIKQ